MKMLHWARFIIALVMVMCVISCCAGGGGISATQNTELTGQLSALFRQDAGISPKGLFLNTAGNLLYVANFGSNGDNGSVSSYSLNSDGSILLLANVAGGVGTNQIILTPNQRYAYAPNYGDNTISMYNVDSSSGVLTSFSQPVQSGGNAPYAIVINSQTTIAYVINFLSADISVFSITSTGESAGVLNLESLVTTGVTSQALLMSADEKYLYVANSAESGLLVYSIESATGNLTFESTVASGNSPVSMVMNSSGTVLYVANFADGTLATYAVDTTTGDLTLEATVAAGQGANAITLTPDGEFLYVANYTDSTIAMYKVDTVTGVPTPLLPSIISMLPPAGPYAIISSLNGRFIYVTELDSNSLSGFLVN